MSLADPEDDFLVLADGTKIQQSTGEVVKEPKKSKWLEVPNADTAQALIVKARKSVADLPAPPAQLTGVALVAFYTLFGLSDVDIAIACDGKVTVEQIKRIRELDPYKQWMEHAKTNIIESSADKVRDLFQSQAINAATKIVETAETADGVLAFKASQDILDRAGHRPADIVEHRHRMEDAFHVIITKKGEGTELPVIDAAFEEIAQ